MRPYGLCRGSHLSWMAECAKQTFQSAAFRMTIGERKVRTDAQ